MSRVLVTGACGFLGRHVASRFKTRGWTVIGIGHGKVEKHDEITLDEWIEADVVLDSLSRITRPLNCIVHCAGGGSVGESILNPMQEFQRTVESREVEYAWLVKRAIIDAKIEIGREPGRVYWANGGGLIGSYAKTENPEKFLLNLALTNSEEGRIFKERLQQLG